MQFLRTRMTNRVPVVKGADLTVADAYSPDIYGKGAWVLHMLRFLMGAERFDEIIWRFSGGDAPGSCRFATTEEFMNLVEEVTTWYLTWFWHRYLFTAGLPSWKMSRVQDGGAERIELEWNDPGFEMPLPVQIGDRRRLVAMPGGRAAFRVDAGAEVVVDPDREVLTASR